MPSFQPGGFADSMYTQFFVTPRLDPSLSFAGQTVIVTGSNIGLGYSAAQQIAERGASRLILAVRTVSKGEAAATQIRSKLSPSSAIKIEVWPLDLSSSQSVKDFAARANELDRLDVLLENAGVARMQFEEEEGEESIIKTNVISTALLALLVLPKLKETAEKYNVTPHLTIVSSSVAFGAAFKERDAENIFEALNDPKGNMMDRYSLSKLLEIFFVRELTERMAASSPTGPLVIVNTLNPGFCESSLRRNVTGIAGVIFAIMEFLLQRKTEIGARTLVHGASAGKETHGQFLSDCHIEANPLDTGKWGDEKVLRKKLWGELMMKLEKIVPGVSKNV